MSVSRKIAEALLQCEAVKISLDPPFTYTSGIKSPVYCDNRRMISFPDERKLIVESFKEMMHANGLEPELLAGTATAGIPWAAFLAYELALPMVYVRSKKKEHGAGKQVEGDLGTGKKVLVVEDLISTGGSSLNSVQALKDEGDCDVLGVMAIMTYEMERARKAFEEAGVKSFVLSNYESVLEVAQERGDIAGEDLEIASDFANDSAAWAEKHGLA